MSDEDPVEEIPYLERAASGPSGSSDTGVVVAGREFTMATVGLFFQTLGFFGYVSSALSAFVTALPFFLLVAIVSIAMVPWIKYNDVLIEEIEFVARCRIEPVYTNAVKPFLEVLQLVYENLICWWDVLWGFPFLMYRQVIYPLAFDCGIVEMLRNLLNFFTAVLFSVANFLGDFFTSDGGGARLDFSRITPTFQAFWGNWQNVVCCSCGILCKILRTLPIFPTILLIAAPIPNILPIFPFIAGDQVGFSETWCAIDNALNAVFELVQIILRLVLDLILLPVTGTVKRPNLRPLSNLLCDMAFCVVRSVERSLQGFWDCFAPFPFKFHEWLCVVDVAVCIVVKLAALILDLVIHIDEVINFPNNPYWGTVIKRDLTEVLNLFAEPANMVRVVNPQTGQSELQPYTQIPVLRGENGPNATTLFTIDTYFWDTYAQLTPLGDANPVYGKRRLHECVCIFLRRTLCDPRANETICFQLDEGGIGANILQDFDLCTVSFALGRFIVDVIAAVFEFTLHLDFVNEPDAFFLFIDQNPYAEIIKDDFLSIWESGLNILTIVPPRELGSCLRDLILEIYRFEYCVLLFLAKYVLGLATLPYFLIDAETRTIKDTPNFITRTDESQLYFVSIFKRLVDHDNPRSLTSCLGTLINNGFPVPPIGCPTCTVTALQDPPILDPNPVTEYPTMAPTTGIPFRAPTVAPTMGVRYQPDSYAEAPKEKEEAKRSRRLKELFPYGRLMVQSEADKEHLFDPYSMLNDIFGYRKEWDVRDEETRGLRMTPLRYYAPHGELRKGYNPFVIGQMLWSNYELLNEGYNGDMQAFFSAKETRAFVRRQKEAIMTEWRTRGSCSALANREYKMSRDPTQKELYQRQLRKGEYEMLRDGTCPRRDTPLGGEKEDTRFTLFPTDPPLATCGNVTAGIPPPPCFDLYCVIRTALELVVHAVSMVARFFNGLIQGVDPNNKMPGESDFGYFTGDFCNRDAETIKPCFESDIIILIRSIVLPLKCLCEFVNLVIPVLPENPRGDLCCSIQRVGELAACVVQLTVNAINALAMGADDDPEEAFSYYKKGEFQRDIARVFVVVEGVAECICVFIRGVFPGNFFSDFKETIEFDPCCFIESILDAVINVVQLIINIIISLATLASGSPESFCYWRIDANICVGMADFGPNTIAPNGTISTIGFVQDVMMVVEALLPESNKQCYTTCMGNDPGMGGVIPCACQVINALLPIRPNASRPISCDPEDPNCAFVDFCCPIVKAGFALRAGARFAVEAFASLWQSWDPGYPEFFTAYIFCNENMDVYGLPEGWGQTMNGTTPSNQDTTMLLTPMDPTRGIFVCGKLNPIIDALVGGEGVISRCLCEYFQLLDWLLSQFFALILGDSGVNQWGNCFCGGSNDPFGVETNVTNGFNTVCTPVPDGITSPCNPEALLALANQNNSILGALSYLIESILKALITLIRRLPDPLYWSPMMEDSINSIEETWIYAFLGPIADAACLALGNLICFINSLFFLDPACIEPGKRFLGGIIRWAFEIVIRLVAFVEGFFKQFLEEPVQCDLADCGEHPGGDSVYGVKGDALGMSIVALFSIPIDVLIGDGSLSCTGMCIPRVLEKGPEGLGPCACYNLGFGVKPNKEYIELTYNITNDAELTLLVLDWWQPDNASNPTTCVPFNNSAPNADVIGVGKICSSTTSCTPQPLCSLEMCVERQYCRYATMPTCGSSPGTPMQIVDQSTRFTPIDGIILGFIRYLKCVTGPLGVIFYPLEVIFSVAWQIAGAVLNFLASILIFFFSLFTLFNNPLGALFKFLAVFEAFVDIFRTPVMVPNINARRNSFAEFKNATNFMHANSGNPIAELGDVLYDFDMSDCFDDLNACVCRNMDVPDLCTWTQQDGVVPASLDTKVTLQYLKDNVFMDQTPCDMDAKACVDSNMEWSAMSLLDRKQFVECLTKRIKGERIHYVYSAFPADYFYNHQGPIMLLGNMGSSLKRVLHDAEQHHRNMYREETRRFREVFPRFGQRLRERRTRVARIMQEQQRMRPDGLMFDAILELDQMWFKWRRGYYHHLFDRGLRNMKRGYVGATPSTRHAMIKVGLRARDLARTIYQQPYGEIIDSMLHASSVAQESYQRMMESGGPAAHIRKIRREATKRWETSPRGYYQRRRRERFNEMMEATPLVRAYRHYTKPASKEGGADALPLWKQYWNEMPLVKHMSNVIAFQRKHREQVGYNFWNTNPLEPLKEIRDAFYKRWTPEWTPEKERNWYQLESFFWQTQERLMPGSTPRHKRSFLLTKNCRIVDDTLVLASRLINYCAAGYTINKPGAAEDICLGTPPPGSAIGSNCNVTRRRSHIVTRSLLNRYRREGDRPESDYEWVPMPMAVSMGKHLNKERPARLFRRLKNQTSSHKQAALRVVRPNHVDKRIYRRAVSLASSTGAGSGPTGTNLYDILVNWLEDALGLDMNQSIDEFIQSVKAWFSNPNIEVSDFPDVGFRYWLVFTFNCRYFENLDCGIGIGLEETLKVVLKWYLLTLGIGGLIVPGVIGPLVVPGTAILFGGIVPAMAWHYSPQCWFMTPTIPMASIQIPIFPFPVSLPALPFCLWQELECLLEKYISKCYDFLIPLYAVNGPICVPCNERIDVINCKAEVGISDGLSNLLYLGYWLLGDSFINFALGFASTGPGLIWPGIDNYLQQIFTTFTTASGSQQQRLTFCFWATIPSILTPIGIIAFVGLVGGSILFGIIYLGGAILAWLGKTPLAAAVPGESSPWLTLPQDDSTPTRSDPGLVEGVSSLIESVFIRRQHT